MNKGGDGLITYQDGVFHLSASGFSYLFRVTEHGQLEQLHFGTPVQTADAAALACKPGLGWGTGLSYDEKSGTCLDVLPLEWSSSGRGDYRESPLELEEGSVDLRYVNYRMGRGIAPM